MLSVILICIFLICQLNPLDRDLDLTVSVIFEPLNFVFARPLLDRISTFFTGYFASSIGDVAIQQDITSTLDETKKVSKCDCTRN